MTHPVIVRDLGRVGYEETWHRMQSFTLEREGDCVDELWLLEHERVFTQGQAGKAEHVLAPGDIPVVKVDRGGQVTYHGPGQLVAYVLLDMSRIGSDVRKLVSALEQSVVNVLSEHQIESAPRPDAPGVYVGDKKICSLGLRIKKGKSFHGLALNIDMDLEPFRRINPCGYAGMEMTQVSDFISQPDMAQIKAQWVEAFTNQLGMTPTWT